MKRISIDKLNEMVDSQYSLVTIISKRAGYTLCHHNGLRN
jgi:DNA-directed RNA polymerase omega subunit